MKHKRNAAQKSRLIVTREAMLDFSRLSTAQRLKWLDETRYFLSKVLPPKKQRAWLAAINLLNQKAD